MPKNSKKSTKDEFFNQNLKELGIDDEETLVISKELDEESKTEEKNQIYN